MPSRVRRRHGPCQPSEQWQSYLPFQRPWGPAHPGARKARGRGVSSGHKSSEETRARACGPPEFAGFVSLKKKPWRGGPLSGAGQQAESVCRASSEGSGTLHSLRILRERKGKEEKLRTILWVAQGLDVTNTIFICLSVSYLLTQDVNFCKNTTTSTLSSASPMSSASNVLNLVCLLASHKVEDIVRTTASPFCSS